MGTLSQAHAQYLDGRGFDPELAVRFGLHSSGSGGGDALVIPYLRGSETVNRKFRTLGPEKRFWQDKGGAKMFWNEDVLRDDTLIAQPLIITEGELDALAAIQSGHARTISVPDGAPAEKIASEESVKYSFLDAAKPLLKGDRVTEIILAVDGDAAGANLLHDLSVRLGRFRCSYLTYPRHPEDRERRLKDLADVLLHYGRRGVAETIARRQWLRVDGVFRMSELPPPPEAPIFDIGFPKLRDHLKVRLGDFTVVTGIPSHGKSSFVNDLCCRLVEAHGLGVAFASFEQQPTRDHRRNLRTWFLRKPVQYADELDLLRADKWIDQHFSFLVPGEDDDVTVDWVLDRCEAAVTQFGARVIVIDPWNEMDHARDRSESVTEYVGRAIKAFKRFARKMMVHLIIVAHPAKQQKNNDGVYSIPTLYDISDSANWYNKADLGVIVHKLGDAQSLIRVSKSRYHEEIGRPGEVEAVFDFPTRRFITDGGP